MKFAVACLIANVAAIRIATPCSDANGVAAADAAHPNAHATIANCWVALSQGCAEGTVAAKDAAHPRDLQNGCWGAAAAFSHGCAEGTVAARDDAHPRDLGNGCFGAAAAFAQCADGQTTARDATHTVQVGTTNCWRTA